MEVAPRYMLFTLLTWFTLLIWFTRLTLLTLFVVFKLINIAQTLACMPIYIVREG